MFKKVVWAMDGSEAADDALLVARTLAVEVGGELLVVHCVELTLPGRLPVCTRSTRTRELEAKIERPVAEFSHGGVRMAMQKTRATVGGVAQALAEIAREQDGEVIVVGPRGRTALAGLMVGSVTQRLLHIASCPVLAVPVNGAHAGA